MKGLLFTYGLTGGGTVAAVFNPFYGFLAYVSFSILHPEHLWFWSVPQGNYSRIIAIAMLISWALHGFGNWRFGRGAASVWAFVGLFAWAALSAVVVAFDRSTAWSYLEFQLKILLPFLVGVTTIDTVRKLRQLAWTLAGSLGYLAFEFNLRYLSGSNPIWPDGFARMDNNCVAIEMVTGTGLTMFLAFRSRKWWQKAAALISAACMAHAIMFSFSRGAFLALIVMTCVAFYLLPKQPKHFFTFAALVLLGVRLAGDGVLARFSTTFADAENRDASAESRLELWTVCLDVISHNPVFGVGPKHLPLVVDQYGFEPGKEAHSLWLQTGAELGLPGLALLLGFYGTCVASLWPMTKESLCVFDPWLHDVARMVIAALAGFAISASFVTIGMLEFPYYTVLLAAAALKLQAAAPAVASH